MRQSYEIRVGQRFGNLVVLKEVDAIHKVKDKYPFRRVLCICDCGNLKEIDYCNLVNGSIQSCGCQKSKKISQLRRRKNNYDLSQKYGIGYTSDGYEFLFDKEDYDIIEKYCWYKNLSGYIVANTYQEDGKKKIIYLHRLILQLTDEDISVVDHNNRNPLDNRKCNLRITTQQNNCINKSKQSNNTSGITGVYWVKSEMRWKASLGLNNKTIHLGYFINKEDAIRARLEGEKKYFGEFSPQKELFEKYKI